MRCCCLSMRSATAVGVGVGSLFGLGFCFWLLAPFKSVVHNANGRPRLTIFRNSRPIFPPAALIYEGTCIKITRIFGLWTIQRPFDTHTVITFFLSLVALAQPKTASPSPASPKPRRRQTHPLSSATTTTTTTTTSNSTTTNHQPPPTRLPTFHPHPEDTAIQPGDPNHLTRPSLACPSVLLAPPSFARLVPSKSFFPPKERESHQPCIRLPPASPLRFHSISLVQFCCCCLLHPPIPSLGTAFAVHPVPIQILCNNFQIDHPRGLCPTELTRHPCNIACAY